MDGETPVASVLNFYFRDEVLPYYGGGTAAARGCAGNDFMYWEVMRRAADRGCRLFDFGRSKLGTGAMAFKRNWGFEAGESALPVQAEAGRSDPRPQSAESEIRAVHRAHGSACRCRSPTPSARSSCAGWDEA